MVVLDVAQGSEAWLRARLGIPTASNFKRIVTPTGALSRAAAQYMEELLAEWHWGERRGVEPTEWMLRGIEMEPLARAAYQEQTGAAVVQVGLVYRDESRRVAASPDGLVGADGLLEIKCPADSTQLAYLHAGELPAAYKPQVQGQLWVTGREWCDFFSYHPAYTEQLLLRIYRDEDYIQRLSAAVEAFVSRMLARRR